MPQRDPAKFAQGMAAFKLAVKANEKAVHRALNREPKGKGWVRSPLGLMVKPDQLREAIELFRKAYAIYPDIAGLNQLALAYEMLGERDAARAEYLRMKAQAEEEQLAPYITTAEMGLRRIES